MRFLYLFFLIITGLLAIAGVCVIVLGIIYGVMNIVWPSFGLVVSLPFFVLLVFLAAGVSCGLAMLVRPHS